MLAVLSEINCLENLKQRGIHPDEFYTDFSMFKNRAIFFREATVVILLFGMSRFNRRLTVELINSMLKRQSEDGGETIQKLIIITDTDLNGVRTYFKFESNLECLDLISSGRVKQRNLNILPDLVKLAASKTIRYLSDYDCSESTDLRQDLQTQRFSAEEREYRRLIQTPNIRLIFEEG